MLNILNYLKKSNIIKPNLDQGNNVHGYRKVTAVNKEWYNSIYAFNKNYTKILPAVHEYVFKLLNRYFNMINEQMRSVDKFGKYVKTDSSSGRKIWISTPEIKHLNDKMYITIYMYNRVYNMYKNKLKSIRFNWGSLKYRNIKYNDGLKTYTRTLKTPTSNYTAFGVKKNLLFINMIKWLKMEKHLKTEQYKLDVIKLTSKNKYEILKGLKYLKAERYNYIINLLYKELAYLRLKQNILFNKFKLSELYVKPIIDILQTIYRKKIIFNIVTLKNFYLNSSILLQIISVKIKNKKTKASHNNIAHLVLSKVKTPILSGRSIPLVKRDPIGKQNIILNPLNYDMNKDCLNQFLLTNNLNSNNWSESNIDKLVMRNLEGKSVSGIFLKISGRLTKRYKAERSIVTYKSKGTLKNVHSAYKGFSSSLPRGYNNVNVEKSMISSKLRIGSFGITGWLSSH